MGRGPSSVTVHRGMCHFYCFYGEVEGISRDVTTVIPDLFTLVVQSRNQFSILLMLSSTYPPISFIRGKFISKGEINLFQYYLHFLSFPSDTPFRGSLQSNLYLNNKI